MNSEQYLTSAEDEIMQKWEKKPVLKPKVYSVTLHICPGRGGEILQKAASILEELTNQKPVFHKAKRTIRNFGIRKGEPIAVSVTIRGEKALEVLDRVVEAVGRRIKAKSFDEFGNFSFGIKEHIDIPGVKYKVEIGVFGMDVNVSLERAGYRVKRRRIKRDHIPRKHLISKEEAIVFAKNYLNIEIVEEE
ncbi:MAG TPA: 50S ribosomal protein L5 [Candidatus Korarchaeota archaeon]|nr:50S ribosomal protein L5 [Candidatus Korarchaeota archaeon]